MVWEGERSPLYKTVEQFNSRSGAAENETSEEIPPRDDKTEHKGFSCPKSGAPSSRGNILERITSDRDFCLIAALILLLIHEKADMKLIIALALILLA